MTNTTITRREMLRVATAAAAVTTLRPSTLLAGTPVSFPSRRSASQDRKFHSAAVETYLSDVSRVITDPELAWLFENCYPNTLDTTIEFGTFAGKPDTAVITGDIPAMWLRDSSAQVWPYLSLAAKDTQLRRMLEGVIRRQARCILIDPYANAFMANLDAPSLEWSRTDSTDMKRGVGERKWELDSLCYPIRLSYGYWRSTGDASTFDETWHAAMKLIVETMRTQQRKHGLGPYHFQRTSKIATETLPADGYGAPVRPVGLIASGFRPSDDACILPFLVPSNLFAVTVLGYLAQMANEVLHDSALANEAAALAVEVKTALQQHALAQTAQGTIWAYEVDGYGSQILMDDANVPSLLALPYIHSSPDAALYARTRSFVWSERNPWFFQGSAGEGIGGPHEGKDMIWPMAITIYALTSQSDQEITHSLTMLKHASAGSGFMHESFNRNNAATFTRSWFAWANSLFGELIANVATTNPKLFGTLR
ncbi:glycoside hydrolase family 125 protein [Granulicella sp. S190]|uniref:glycoside hydrolase family 125 protein n=1 Tax=Granulicella sp. S190 TaxID=1747226 RepID=UPI00131AB2CF|nr:glycoside hydrolase family 125 protein [Granulicella sp. S190]